MIFCVGTRRSGTNWLQRILTSHPEVVAVPSETYLFSRGLAPLGERFHHGVRSSPGVGSVFMNREAYIEAVRAFCDAVFAQFLDGDRHRYVLERTPEHALSLDLIGEVYPDSHIVHIIRDGRDVVRSLLSMEWGPDSVEDATAEWQSCVETGQQAGRQLEHYREVRYEALLEDPEEHIRGLFTWLGIEASDARVAEARAEAGARFNVDPRAPEVTSGKWRTGLAPDQLAIFERIAGSTMAALGYGTTELVPEPERSSSSGRRGRIERLAGRARSVVNFTAPNSDHEALRRLRAAQPLVDQFVEFAARGRSVELKALLSDDVYVRVVSADDDWSRRGGGAVDALIRTLSEDTALRGKQVWADTVPSLPTFTMLIAFRAADGNVEERAFALTVENATITRVVYYRLPVYR